VHPVPQATENLEEASLPQQHNYYKIYTIERKPQSLITSNIEKYEKMGQ
jgi:hypothetical protein